MVKSNRIAVDGCKLFIVHDGFEFVCQSCVKFYGKRLSKQELIKCCNHFISELKFLGYSDRVKIGFNLKCFRYYELSVYLHGLMSLYCSLLDYDCPPCFGLVFFSHLPHDVLKPDKELKDVQVAMLQDVYGGSYYLCVVSCTALISDSLEGLRQQIENAFPDFTSKYRFRFDVAEMSFLPF